MWKLESEDVALIVWLLCDDVQLCEGSFDTYTPSASRSLLKVAQTYASKRSQATVVLCPDATLRGGGLEATRHLLHSHGRKVSRDVGCNYQNRTTALRKRTRLERSIQYAVKIAAEGVGGGCVFS